MTQKETRNTESTKTDSLKQGNSSLTLARATRDTHDTDLQRGQVPFIDKRFKVEISQISCSPASSPYSSRNNIIGSTHRARRAGIHVASSPSSAIASTKPASTTGSLGEA